MANNIKRIVSPHVGTDPKEFDFARRVAVQTRSTVLCEDRAGNVIGTFNVQGDFAEAPARTLTASLKDRLLCADYMHNHSKRGHRSAAASLGLLARYEAQQ